MKLLLGVLLVVYAAVHFYTKRSVDKYNNYGRQKRHYHKYLDRD